VARVRSRSMVLCIGSRTQCGTARSN
jgi:hypothetical protein